MYAIRPLMRLHLAGLSVSLASHRMHQTRFKLLVAVSMGGRSAICVFFGRFDWGESGTEYERVCFDVRIYSCGSSESVRLRLIERERLHPVADGKFTPISHVRLLLSL